MKDDWIKFRKVLVKDGRVRIVSRKCRQNVATVIGGLVVIWSLADDFADEDGVMIGYTPEDLDEEIGIDGFCRSLPECWIDLTGEYVKLPEYQQHNGSTAKNRSVKTKQKQEQRCRQNVAKMSPELETREEKRREEKNKKETNKKAADADVGKPDAIDWESVRNRWNNEIAPLAKCPTVSKITDSRRSKFRSRMKENQMPPNELLDAIAYGINPCASFVVEGNWFGFDWAFKNAENATKIIEGNYREEKMRDSGGIILCN